ncbi:DoxX family protein [Algoriphagus namhaensis]
MKHKIRTGLLYIMAFFYLVAGVNHFIKPEFYLPLIPDYMPDAALLNIISGVAEILGAIGLLIPATRKLAAWGIILMLVAFVPSHVYFIQIGSCVPDVLCVDEWIGWVRLIVIHPVLIYWAWIYTKKENDGPKIG